MQAPQSSVSTNLSVLRTRQALAAAPGGGPHLVFLGTGCAEPSKYRGASALHLRAAPGAGLLLDAGEGAWGQLVRFYGRRGALQQVGAPAVTYVHALEYGGLAGLVCARDPGESLAIYWLLCHRT